MPFDRRTIRCGALAAALVLLLASCSGSRQSVSATKAAPRGDVATCAKYEDSPTRRAQCLLLTGPNKHDFIPEIGRRADLDTQLRCHPFRPSVDAYARCLGLEPHTASLDEEQWRPSASAPAASASRTPPSMGPDASTYATNLVERGAGPLNIAFEGDAAVPDNQPGGQAGGSGSDLTRKQPRLDQAPAGAGSAVGHPAKIANATSSGDPVAAPVSGRVVFAGPFKRYGPLLIIQHDEYHTVLWGFAQLEVVVDDLVVEGQTLGLIRGESRRLQSCAWKAAERAVRLICMSNSSGGPT